MYTQENEIVWNNDERSGTSCVGYLQMFIDKPVKHLNRTFPWYVLSACDVAELLHNWHTVVEFFPTKVGNKFRDSTAETEDKSSLFWITSTEAVEVKKTFQISSRTYVKERKVSFLHEAMMGIIKSMARTGSTSVEERAE